MKGMITHKKIQKLIKQAGADRYNIAVLYWKKTEQQCLYIVQGAAVLQIPITSVELSYFRVRGVLIILCDKQKKQ